MWSQTPQDTVENPHRDPLFHSLSPYKVEVQPVKVISSSSARGLEHSFVNYMV